MSESPGHNRFDPERVYRYRVVPTRPRMLRDGSTGALEIDGEWVRASDFDQLYEVAERMARAIEDQGNQPYPKVWTLEVQSALAAFKGCPDCDGTGNAPNADTDMAICPTCHGKGESNE